MKKLKPQRVDAAQINRFLKSSEKKLKSARQVLAIDEEASLQLAYEAILKASIGFMLSYGYRARSQPGHHVTIIEFVRAHIDGKHAALLTIADRLRRKRNMVLYDEAGFVSRQDAEHALEAAREYLTVIRQQVGSRIP
jgi:ADP-ribose pyrophosphatase YjhB (NUDIX family)